MWKISPQPFGFVLTFSGRIEPDEMRDWVSEARRQLNGALPPGWGVVVDMRELEPLSAATQAVMVEGQ
jgi:hypothetical protein